MVNKTTNEAKKDMKGREDRTRIAVHTLWDFCLPLQRGKPGTDERIKSNREIEDALTSHDCEFEDIEGAGYFIPAEWHEKDGQILFKNSDGDWETVPKEWVIFESQHPEFLKGLDKQGERDRT
jgi:hypothetical protein